MNWGNQVPGCPTEESSPRFLTSQRRSWQSSQHWTRSWYLPTCGLRRTLQPWVETRTMAQLAHPLGATVEPRRGHKLVAEQHDSKGAEQWWNCHILTVYSTDSCVDAGEVSAFPSFSTVQGGTFKLDGVRSFYGYNILPRRKGLMMMMWILEWCWTLLVNGSSWWNTSLHFILFGCGAASFDGRVCVVSVDVSWWMMIVSYFSWRKWTLFNSEGRHEVKIPCGDDFLSGAWPQGTILSLGVWIQHWGSPAVKIVLRQSQCTFNDFQFWTYRSTIVLSVDAVHRVIWFCLCTNLKENSLWKCRVLWESWFDRVRLYFNIISSCTRVEQCTCVCGRLWQNVGLISGDKRKVQTKWIELFVTHWDSEGTKQNYCTVHVQKPESIIILVDA